MLSKSGNKAIIDRVCHTLALSLLILAGWWCGQLVWALAGMSQEVPNARTDGIEVKPEAQLKTDIDGYAVAQWSLFGKAGKKKVEVAAPQEAPKTSLNLTLVGAFVGQDQEFSTAMIEASGRNAEVYRIGDSLPGGARLKFVYPDRVIIDYRGRAETLFFDAVKSVLTEGPTLTSQLGALERLTPRAVMLLAQRSPAAFADKVGINLDEGEYILNSGPLLSILAPVGGRQGDIIRELNGVVLTGDPQEDVELIMAEMTGDQAKFRVVLDRNGVPILLEGDMR